jgi:uncharacterized protein (TIGR02001 family)
MKKLQASLIASAVALSLSPVAHAEFSANIGVTSNYLWRGVTQTDDGAAVQGGIDYAHESGFYAGTWASNIDWGVGTSGAEVDLYGGFAGEYNDFGYDIGLIYYWYPADGYEDSDFTEIYASGSYKWFELGLAYTVDGDQPGDAPFSDGDLYIYGAASFDVADTWSVGLTLGHYDFDVPRSLDADYTHGQIDITKSAGDFGDFTFTVSTAEETSISTDDTKVVVSWAKSF